MSFVIIDSRPHHLHRAPNRPRRLRQQRGSGRRPGTSTSSFWVLGLRVEGQGLSRGLCALGYTSLLGISSENRKLTTPQRSIFGEGLALSPGSSCMYLRPKPLVQENRITTLPTFNCVVAGIFWPYVVVLRKLLTITCKYYCRSFCPQQKFTHSEQPNQALVPKQDPQSSSELLSNAARIQS